jgi:hypothetical protein
MEIRDKQQVLKKRVNLALVIAILALLLASAVLMYVNGERNEPQLSAYSEDWDGVSNFRQELENNSYSIRTIISSPELLRNSEERGLEPDKTLYVAIGVERLYLDSEADAIRSFVDKGGRILIADDFGYANTLAPEFKVSYLKGQLYDEAFEKNPKFVIRPVNFNEDAIRFSGTVMFNEPSGLKVGGSATVIAESSAHSWLDANFNQQRDLTFDAQGRPKDIEAYSSYPMVALWQGDLGKAIFVSDSSVFINDMIGRHDNREFALSLVEYLLPSGGTVIFDESRHNDQNPATNMEQESFHLIVVGTTNNNFKILTGTVVVLALIVLLVALNDPTPMVHRQVLSKVQIDELRASGLSAQDEERIRKVLLDAVRHRYALTPEELVGMKVAQLEEMIGDEVLLDFALKGKKKYYGQELEQILVKIKEWVGDVE